MKAYHFSFMIIVLGYRPNKRSSNASWTSYLFITDHPHLQHEHLLIQASSYKKKVKFTSPFDVDTHLRRIFEKFSFQLL